jgi:hypothetical protein
MQPWTLREAPPKATDWSGIKNGKPSKETRLSWYQSIDEKYFWVYVKFEVGLSILFTRKRSSKKVILFPRSVLRPFFLKSCLILRTEIDNPPSNFTGITIQCISIVRYTETSIFMWHATVSATRSPKKAIDWSDTKNGKSSKEIRLS